MNSDGSDRIQGDVAWLTQVNLNGSTYVFDG